MLLVFGALTTMPNLGVIRVPIVDDWPDGLTRHDIDRCRLPEGFRIPFDATTMECLEPVTTYLWREYVYERRVFVENSQAATSFDLYEFFCWLDESGIPWNSVKKSHLKTYSNAQLNSKSPLTGRIYSNNTVRRRLVSIIQFYLRLKRRGLVETDIAEAEAVGKVPRNRVSLSHITSPNKRSQSDLLPAAVSHQPHRMSETQIREIFKKLGPMPSGRTPETSGRPWLASTFSLTTGTRCDEVAHLPMSLVAQALKVRPRPPMTEILLTHTKGLVPRNIFVPDSVLDQTEIYVAGERAEAIKRGRASGRTDHDRLFVNSPLALDRDVGRPVTAHTLWRDFHEAVIEAGYFTAIPADPVARIGAQVDAFYTYHDNRHTYAINQYLFRKRSGDAEPWKAIQLLLGHKHLATTTDIYLDAVKVAEPELSDMTERAIIAIYDAATH